MLLNMQGELQWSELFHFASVFLHEREREREREREDLLTYVRELEVRSPDAGLIRQRKGRE